MTINIDDITEKELAKGIIGRYVHSKNVTIGYVNIDKGAILPIHSHVNEQITQMISGRLQMTIDSVTTILEPNTITIIPSNAVHSAVALTDCVVIDTFYPIREDYK